MNLNVDNFNLKDYEGKKVILYFYPKDSTSGCTKEAINFSEHKDIFDKDNVVIFGVSRDSEKSHDRFIEKNNLTINLLSDPDMKLHNKFNVLENKDGKIKVIRSTFIFDENNELIKEFRKVKVDGHVDEILRFLEIDGKDL